MQYVNGLDQPSSRRCFLVDRISTSAAAARFLDMTAADAIFKQTCECECRLDETQMAGTFVIERPCNAYYFLEKARRVRPARSAARLLRVDSSEMLLEALRLSRAKIHQSTTTTCSRLSKAIPPFSRPKLPLYSQQIPHIQHVRLRRRRRR